MDPSSGQESGLWSLAYYENLRKTATQVTRNEGSNVDLVTVSDDLETTVEPQVLPICHLNFMQGWSFSNSPIQAALMAMAAHHLNTGDSTFVPSLQGLPERCPIRFTVEATDTKFDRGTALDRMKETIRLRSVPDFDYTASPPAPCAIIGEVLSSVTVVTAPVSGIFDIPQVSGSATSADLDNKSIYKLFGRTVPSDSGIAVTVVQFLSGTLGARYFNVVYQNDAFQNALVVALQDSIKEYAPDMLMHTVVYSPDSPTGAYDAVKRLKNSRYRYTLNLVWTNEESLFQEAHAQGLGGDGLHQWFFIGDTSPSIDIYTEDSPFYDFFQGIGVIEITSGEAGMPEFDKWTEELIALPQTSRQYLTDFLSTIYTPEQLQDEVFAPDSRLMQGSSGIYGPFRYDAVIGLGLAACNAWEADSKTLRGQDHYATFKNVTFTGVTGNVVLNSAASREPTSSLYRLRNYRRKQENETFYGFESITSYYYRDGNWVLENPYIFNDGTENIPIDIGPLPTDEDNFFDNTYAVVGVAAAFLAILVVIFFIVREMKRKANDLLWKIKKEDLDFPEPPKVLGRGTFGEVLLAEYRGTQVAVKQILKQSGSVNGSSTSPSAKVGTLSTRYGTHSVGLSSLRYKGSLSTSSNSSDEENGRKSKGMTSTRRKNSKGRNGSKSMQKRIREDFIEEMRQLSRLRHPNIATVMGAVLDYKCPMLVMEFMPMGSLYDVIHNPTIQLDGDTIIDILCDITQGMRFLHKSDPPVIHGDLKAQNVLIDNHFRAKVSDFGLAQNDAVGGTGTPYWMAPELLREESANTSASDIFSFGVLMFEVCVRQQPYEGEDANAVIAAIKDKNIKKRVSFPPNLSDKARALMVDCMDEKPEARASFDEIDGRLRRLEPDALVPHSALTKGKKSERSLQDIFPAPIAKVLQAGGRVGHEYKENVAIFACSVAGLDDIIAEMSPFKKARMIERLQTNMRNIAKKHGVFMVESDGDVFVAVSNLVKQNKNTDHILRMVDFAFEATLSNQTLIDDTNPSSQAYVTLKAGLHLGSLTTAVIGNRNPRFALLGEEVHTACTLAKHSKVGMITTSKQAGEAIASHGTIEVKPRDDTTVYLRCQGEVECFWVARKDRLAMDTLERVRANQRLRHLQRSMKTNPAQPAENMPISKPVPPAKPVLPLETVDTSQRVLARNSLKKSVVEQVKEEPEEEDVSESQHEDLNKLQDRIQSRLSGSSFDVDNINDVV